MRGFSTAFETHFSTHRIDIFMDFFFQLKGTHSGRCEVKNSKLQNTDNPTVQCS